MKLIFGYTAHKRMPSRANRIFDLERGPNWWIARIGSVALRYVKETGV